MWLNSNKGTKSDMGVCLIYCPQKGTASALDVLVAQSGADDKTKCDGPGNLHEQGRGLSKYPSEAAHILDGLLHHECSLEIREHYTDTASAIDHVLVYAISWCFGSRRAFAILPIADCLSLTAAPFTPP